MRHFSTSVWATLLSTLIAGLIALETGIRHGEGGLLLLLAFSIQSLTALKAAISPSPAALGGMSVTSLVEAMIKSPALLATVLAAAKHLDKPTKPDPPDES
jgi:hypothetical protein